MLKSLFIKIILISIICLTTSLQDRALAFVHHRHGTDMVEQSIPTLKTDKHVEPNKNGHKACEHHSVCPPDHICKMKGHQCHAENGNVASPAACFIAGECGGGNHETTTNLNPYNHKFASTKCFTMSFHFSGCSQYQVTEIMPTGFTIEIEHPPRVLSL